MTRLSDQNRALADRLGIKASWLWKRIDIDPSELDRLLDAARAEGAVQASDAFERVDYQRRWPLPARAAIMVEAPVDPAILRDATRYRWLRENGMPPSLGDDLAGQELDEGVDEEIFLAALHAAGFAPPPPPLPLPPGPRSLATPAQGLVVGRIVYPEGWVK